MEIYTVLAWTGVAAVWALCVLIGLAVVGATKWRVARRLAEGFAWALRPLGAKPPNWAAIDQQRPQP